MIKINSDMPILSDNLMDIPIGSLVEDIYGGIYLLVYGPVLVKLGTDDRGIAPFVCEISDNNDTPMRLFKGTVTIGNYIA